MSVCLVDKVRTVSDAKRDFYTHHTRPINSIYRRFVEELIVEMHLLSVNTDFRYDAIYALGVVTAFERFMQGYQPEQDKSSIFAALCQATGGNWEQYRQEAGEILAQAKQMSVQELIAKINSSTPTGGENRLVETLQAIANRSNYKYSRLFAIGLYTLLAEADPDILRDPEKRDRTLKEVTEALHLSPEKLQKDLDLYRSNLDKMDQLLKVLEEALEAERKKRQQQKPEQGTAQINNDEKNP
ncbi:photosystem II biogenesis protein Psp29 [Pleurocapsa sp. PCC 7327]|nr:photosystem II biogenesis protein Psp29 [Pleurocapsa sp. PCC 7327]AFY78656.1 photosystem II biogenesis protein Psp29 [Pleurocapsa sp. PCC 7327]